MRKTRGHSLRCSRGSPCGPTGGPEGPTINTPPPPGPGAGSATAALAPVTSGDTPVPHPEPAAGFTAVQGSGRWAGTELATGGVRPVTGRMPLSTAALRPGKGELGGRCREGQASPLHESSGHGQGERVPAPRPRTEASDTNVPCSVALTSQLCMVGLTSGPQSQGSRVSQPECEPGCARVTASAS